MLSRRSSRAVLLPSPLRPPPPSSASPPHPHFVSTGMQFVVRAGGPVMLPRRSSRAVLFPFLLRPPPPSSASSRSRFPLLFSVVVSLLRSGSLHDVLHELFVIPRSCCVEGVLRSPECARHLPAGPPLLRGRRRRPAKRACRAFRPVLSRNSRLAPCGLALLPHPAGAVRPPLRSSLAPLSSPPSCIRTDLMFQPACSIVRSHTWRSSSA